MFLNFCLNLSNCQQSLTIGLQGRWFVSKAKIGVIIAQDGLYSFTFSPNPSGFAASRPKALILKRQPSKKPERKEQGQSVES